MTFSLSLTYSSVNSLTTNVVLPNGFIVSPTKYYIGGNNPSDMYTIASSGSLYKQLFVFSFDPSETLLSSAPSMTISSLLGSVYIPIPPLALDPSTVRPFSKGSLVSAISSLSIPSLSPLKQPSTKNAAIVNQTAPAPILSIYWFYKDSTSRGSPYFRGPSTV